MDISLNNSMKKCERNKQSNDGSFIIKYALYREKKKLLNPDRYEI